MPRTRSATSRHRKHCRACREPMVTHFCEICDEEVAEYCPSCHEAKRHTFRQQHIEPVSRSGRVVGRDPEKADAAYNGSFFDD